METNIQSTANDPKGKAIVSLILGIIGMIAWIIPIIGIPIIIVGLVFSVKGLKSSKKGIAKTGLVLCIIGLVLSIISSVIGAYMGTTGQHPYVNEILNDSKKGNWSENDKQQAKKEAYAIEELSSFGDNKSKWIECYLSKCEANYSSYYEANQDELGCIKLALECNDEIASNGSKKGNWSENDKQQFIRNTYAVEKLSDYSESDKSKIVECYLSKCESNYSSYYEANQDIAGSAKLALECCIEVLNK